MIDTAEVEQALSTSDGQLEPATFTQPPAPGMRSGSDGPRRPRRGEDPIRIASSILGGDVLRAIGYAEPSTGALRVAAVRRTSARDLDVRVHLLEAVGPTYRCVWSSSEDLFSFADTRVLDAEDIDHDGICELIFTDRMYGTHQSSHFLYLYFPRLKQLFSISEHSNPSWFPEAPTPNLMLDPEPPPELRDPIIDAATARGFLRFVEEDIDHPDAAMRRWLRDNGHTPNGPIVVHEYEGPPAWGATANDMLVVGDTAWCAHFRGPLIHYDRRNNRHYIAYAPADRYSCAKALVWDGTSLWFGIHVEAGLGRFHEPSKTLQRIERVGDLVLPEVWKLTYDENERRLIINGEININLNDVPPLPRF